MIGILILLLFSGIAFWLGTEFENNSKTVFQEYTALLTYLAGVIFLAAAFICDAIRANRKAMIKELQMTRDALRNAQPKPTNAQYAERLKMIE